MSKKLGLQRARAGHVLPMQLRRGRKVAIDSPSLHDGIGDSIGNFVDYVGNKWPFTPRQAFAAWYLMRGGIDSPLRLSELIGIARAGVSFNDLFLSCDNMATKVETYVPEKPLRLKKGRSVTCGGCGSVLRSLPCPTCRRPDYTSGRSDQAILQEFNTHGHVSTGQLVNSHNSAYHGGYTE